MAGTVEVERLNAEEEIARDIEPDHGVNETEPQTVVNKNKTHQTKEETARGT